MKNIAMNSGAQLRTVNRGTRPTAVFSIVAAILMAGPGSAANSTPVAVTACQTVISASGSYFLDNDLNCNGAPFGVAIVGSNVDFDLKGHTISNNATYQGSGIGTGVPPFSGNACLQTTGIHIHGGGVSGFSTGMRLCANGLKNATLNAVVDHMFAVDNSFAGVAVLGSNTRNQVEMNYMSKNGIGVYLGGPASSGNDIGDNLINGNGIGIFVDAGSADNTVHNNTMTNATVSQGMFIAGNNNTVQANFFSANAIGLEILALASGNKLSGNTAAGNLDSDLKDDNGFCGLNTWQNNLSGARSPACIQ